MEKEKGKTTNQQNKSIHEFREFNISSKKHFDVKKKRRLYIVTTYDKPVRKEDKILLISNIARGNKTGSTVMVEVTKVISFPKLASNPNTQLVFFKILYHLPF